MVVAYDEGHEEPYIIFYEMDGTWERVGLPDQSVVYKKGLAAEVCVPVEDDMLPGTEDDL